MKKILFEKPHQPFLILALLTFSIFIFFKGAHPETTFDLYIFDHEINSSMSFVWLVFTLYLLVLSIIYFIITRSKLKPLRFMVLMHYIFLVLFLVFFVVFSAFENEDLRRIISGGSFSTLLNVYACIFAIDFIFLAGGILLLFINLFVLSKKK